MFKRKFKIRIVHYINGSFCVQYSYHFFFPRYKYIYNMKNLGFSDIYDTYDFWGRRIFTTPEEAEKFAKTFDTYQDVLDYHKKEDAKFKEHIEKLNEHRQKKMDNIKKYDGKIIK